MKTNQLLFALCLALPVAAFAQSPAPAAQKDPSATPGIDKRQANQEARIEQGVKSGELNQKEAARLEKGQARVQSMEDKAKADGKVTAKERKRINKAEDKQSRRIHRQKHDKQPAK